MDPISSQFSYDFQKFVLQNPNVREFYYQIELKKPFSLDPPDKSDKTKKDLKKQKEEQKKKKKKKGSSEERPYSL